MMRGAAGLRTGAIALVLLAAAGCDPAGEVPGDEAPADEAPLPEIGSIVPMSSPAEGATGEPNLFTADDGTVYLSWFERGEGATHRLRFSTLDPGAAAAWSEPRTIVEGDEFFVNWADFPSMHRLDDGTLAAHWLVRAGSGPVDYDVHVSWSDDGGESWRESVVPHRDGVHGEHGFVSLFPWSDGELGAIWLDARNLELTGTDDADGPAAMSLRFTSLTPDGAGEVLGEELLLDERVCDCCQTSAAMTSAGPVVVYRDRTEAEIRDIAVVRHVDGSWTEPQTVHDDGWEISACPVNGPMVDARDQSVVVAWFTMAEGEPVVRAAFSDDAGASFGAPVRIDDGNPVGRVGVSLLADGEALVSWLERTDEQTASVRVRTVAADGRLGASSSVAQSSPGRSSGFPQMARAGSDLVFAWTDVSDSEAGPTVRVARGEIGAVSGDEAAGFEPLDEPAPEYTAANLDGTPVSLADYRGEAVLLNVWATWCAPCRVEMPELQALSDELEGLRVVGVSIDRAGTEAMIDRFLDELSIDFTILRDPEDRISGLLSAHAVPLTVLIDREGRIQWRHMGPVRSDDPGLRAALDHVL